MAILWLLAAVSPAHAAKPNILFIVTDDQRPDETVVSDLMPKTVQWFRDGGKYFPNAVATTPVCCPSRATIFTGRYSHNHQIRIVPDPNRYPSSDLNAHFGLTPAGEGQRSTLQRYLKDAGYQTAIFGKYLNGWPIVDVAKPPPYFDQYSIWANGAHSGIWVNEQGTVKQIPDYETKYTADKAIDFLDTADPAKPWFMYLAPTVPHSPFTPEDRFATSSIPPFQPTPNYFEQDRRDKPSWVQKQVEDEDTVQKERAALLRMMKSMDESVDRVMTRLAELGQADNTIAFFVSDNGWLWGDHGMRSKGQPYSESIRIPYYMRWPAGGIGVGEDTRLVGNHDMAPTAVDAADLTAAPSPAMDGHSLLASTNSRNRSITEAWANADGPFAIPSWRSLRTPTFQYTEYYTDTPETPSTQTPTPLREYLDPAQTLAAQDNGDPSVREYYDLTSDSAQRTNLLKDGDPLNDPPTGFLSAQLETDRTCSGASCPSAGDPAVLPVDTAITSGPARSPDSSGFTSAEFRFTSSEPSATFECRRGDPVLISGLPWQPCTNPKQYSGLPPQSQQAFEVRAIGPSGIRDPSPPPTYIWNIDSSRPDTKITSQPARYSDTGSALFQIESSNPNDTFECQLDGSAYTSCLDPVTYPGLPDGTHTFNVRAKRGASVDPTPSSHRWQVDASIPVANVSGPISPVYGTSTTITITSSKPATNVECQLDGGSFRPCAVTVDDDSTTFNKAYEGLSDGSSHTVRARVTDRAGHVSAPATFSWHTEVIPTLNDAPDTTWPDIADASGEVRAIVPDGAGGWYVGGRFTRLVYSDGRPAVDSTNLVHIHSNTSITSMNPGPNATVRALLLSDDRSTLFVGGDFTSVGGIPRNRLAAINTATNAVTTWNPNPDGQVYALARGAGSLYAGGAFSSVGGPCPTGSEVSCRRGVAEISVNTGMPTAWNANANAGAIVHALAVNGAHVYAGGTFNQIGGRLRANLVELSRRDGLATGWNPAPDNLVRTLGLTKTSIYAGGSFGTISGAFRRRAAEIALGGSSAAMPWNPSPSATGEAPGTVWEVNVLPPSVVVGGVYLYLRSSIGRSRLAEVTPHDGLPTDWKPDMNSAVYESAMSDGVLAVGGAFTHAGTVPRRYLAFFRDDAPQTSITASPGNPTSSRDANFSFASSERRSTFECRLDGASWTACASPTSYSELTDGSHTFDVRAIDSKGTPDVSSATYTWTVGNGVFAATPGVTVGASNEPSRRSKSSRLRKGH